MNDIIYCCKIIDRSESFEMTDELLSSLEYDFSSWENVAEKIAFHTVYFLERDAAEKAFIELKDAIEAWREFGVNISQIERIDLKKEDWSETWKKYFNIQHLSERLVIRPTWLEYKAKPGQVVVDLDPGMSFGTGQHPTTSFCLKMIDRLAPKNEKLKFLDAGCGSGILSIAAVKLGYSDVHAFDIDQEAVDVSLENIEKNKLSSADIKLSRAALEEFKSPLIFDVVVANILANILAANTSTLLKFLKPGGWLILAGILKTEYEETILKAFEKAGCVEELRVSEGEWTGGLFRRS